MQLEHKSCSHLCKPWKYKSHNRQLCNFTRCKILGTTLQAVSSSLHSLVFAVLVVRTQARETTGSLFIPLIIDISCGKTYLEHAVTTPYLK